MSQQKRLPLDAGKIATAGVRDDIDRPSSDSGVFVPRRTASRSLLARLGMALAFLCFGVGTLLSSTPSVSRAAAPSADAVRRARGAAVEVAMALAADGTPRRVQLSRRDLEASATLLAHGFDWLRVRPTIAGEAFVSDASLRIADATWLNVSSRIAPGATAFPDVTIGAGAWRFPPFVIRGALRLVDHWARWRGFELPPTASMVRNVAVGRDAVAATLAVPRQLFRVASELTASSRPSVDPAVVAAIYRRLTGAGLAPDVPLAMPLRLAFAGRPNGVDAVEYNRAAFIALAMYVVSPRAQRLAGSDVTIDQPGEPAPTVKLAGRLDLAKHFTLSAALATTLDPRFTRAMGEWKELDDSLPGGSGFSFVDLTADRAGLHLARAALDPATAAAVADRLAAAEDGELFPSAARRLAEGLSETEFRSSYGGLDAAAYAAAVRRADRLLARLPLYAPYVPS